MSGPVRVAVLIGDEGRRETWLAALREAAPEFDIAPGERFTEPDEVTFAVVWRAAAGSLRRFRNLRAVLSLGAGVDAILRDPDLPPEVPVVRMVDEALTEGMREYVLAQVLRYHRAFPFYAAAQTARRWDPRPYPLARERRVGVMGLGVLGADVARHVAALGFDVKGWSRSPKRIAGVEAFAGRDTLYEFAGKVDILVCLLPLTPDTENILDARLFNALPRGAFLVNVARGEHLVESDLLAALASGQLAGATLDAFREEPLPPEHPFWSHPAITVTPHIASLTRVDSGARHLVAEMQRILAGKGSLHAADRNLGY